MDPVTAAAAWKARRPIAGLLVVLVIWTSGYPLPEVDECRITVSPSSSTQRTFYAAPAPRVVPVAEVEDDRPWGARIVGWVPPTMETMGRGTGRIVSAATQWEGSQLQQQWREATVLVRFGWAWAKKMWWALNKIAEVMTGGGGEPYNMSSTGVMTVSIPVADRPDDGCDEMLLAPLPFGEDVPEQYREMVYAAAASCPGLDPAVLAAQIGAESGWDPGAVSQAGAVGIAQFVPATAAYNCVNLAAVAGVPGDPVALMLAAYNAGPGAVLEYQGVPPYAETQAYVQRVMAAVASSSVGACEPTQWTAVEAGLQPRARQALRCAGTQFPEITSVGGKGGRGNTSYHPTGEAVDLMVPLTDEGRARGDRIAAWAVRNAAELGITQVIWYDHIWTSARGEWRPYAFPGCGSVGCGSSTQRHMDHPHLSIPERISA